MNIHYSYGTYVWRHSSMAKHLLSMGKALHFSLPTHTHTIPHTPQSPPYPHTESLIQSLICKDKGEIKPLYTPSGLLHWAIPIGEQFVNR